MSPTQGLPPPESYPQLLTELASVVARVLTENELADDRAAAIAATVVDHVTDLYGGQVIYVPKAARQKTHRRWQAMWEEFTGHNHAELARKYGMGVHAVYKALAVMRAESSKRVYGGQDLFSQLDQAHPGQAAASDGA
jgi:Mor family transcriptional regulator